MTSYPDRTSPVVRGKWILENLLGAPPPPPPPNVPALEETSATRPAALTMRERMAQHRANPVCASCHALMDPLGFALENFDAVGRWRTLDESGDADRRLGHAARRHARSTGVDGAPRGAARRSGAVRARRSTEKLLTYALGRGVEHYDMPAVRAIVRDAARERLPVLGSSILGVVQQRAVSDEESGDL